MPGQHGLWGSRARDGDGVALLCSMLSIPHGGQRLVPAGEVNRLLGEGPALQVFSIWLPAGFPRAALSN